MKTNNTYEPDSAEKTEIVVTEAMIEAGANELAWYDRETESAKEYMVAVYRAMHRARET